MNKNSSLFQSIYCDICHSFSKDTFITINAKCRIKYGPKLDYHLNEDCNLEYNYKKGQSCIGRNNLSTRGTKVLLATVTQIKLTLFSHYICVYNPPPKKKENFLSFLWLKNQQPYSEQGDNIYTIQFEVCSDKQIHLSTALKRPIR